MTVGANLCRPGPEGYFPVGASGEGFGLPASGEGRRDSVGLCVSRTANAALSTLIFALSFFCVFFLVLLVEHKSVYVVQSKVFIENS